MENFSSENDSFDELKFSILACTVLELSRFQTRPNMVILPYLGIPRTLITQEPCMLE